MPVKSSLALENKVFILLNNFDNPVLAPVAASVAAAAPPAVAPPAAAPSVAAVPAVLAVPLNLSKNLPIAPLVFCPAVSAALATFLFLPMAFTP